MKKLLAIMLAIALVVPLSFLSSGGVDADTNRIYGEDRVETAVEISKAGWSNGSSTVIISTGWNFPDALAGAPLAYAQDAPILLTQANRLPVETIEEIERLGAQNAIVLGGEVAVSGTVFSELQSLGLDVNRIAGDTRSGTALEIAQGVGDSSRAILVDGYNFPDALAIAPYAAREGIPIFLTEGNQVTSDTLAALNSANEVIVVGGEIAISPEIFNQIDNATRISGNDRYDTAVQLIDALGMSLDDVYVATGRGFADALTGSVLAAKNDASIILTEPHRVPSYVEPLLSEIGQYTILGGPIAVSAVVAEAFELGYVPLPEEPESLFVHYIDVGQGDSTLLQGPDFTILVDAGRHDRNDVVPYLESVGVDELDLLIGTHPHADHIGQFPEVLDAFDVTEVWMSGDEHTSLTFERAIDAIEASGADYNEPRAGEEYLIGSLEIEVFNPSALTGSLNDNSISFKATYNDFSFLFTGDAEVGAEQAMISAGYDLSSDVYHVGHHGSSTSSTQAFLTAIAPEVAIYSAGQDNSYGHPTAEVVNRIQGMGIDLFGTDVHGTVIIETDGESYAVETERSGTVVPGPTDPVPGQVDINSASFDDLQLIIHVGPDRAQQIIDLRPFSSVNDLQRVSGLGPATVQDIINQGIAYVAD